MQFSRQRRLIFVHNQKTAGTSVAAFLRQHIADLKQWLPDHAYAEEGIALLGRAEWDRHYSFGFVRNPWARLVSWHRMIMERPLAGQRNAWWTYVRARGGSFEDFITLCTDEITEPRGAFVARLSAVRNQLDYFTDAEGREAVTFIGRYEQFERDFAIVQRALGLPVQPLPSRNKLRPKDYRAFYNDRTRELVAQRFARDIQRFGYAFDDAAAGAAPGVAG